MPSKFDALHDQVWGTDPANPIRKAGTRYERLMAAVARVLLSNHAVIHDIHLRGESDVKHQIDVLVSGGSDEPKRILIECKDFSVSGEKVGLEIVRGFSAVVDDIKPDHAMIVTCEGFTRDAIKFAAHKKIRLCTLQRYEDAGQRIERININLQITRPELKYLDILGDTAIQRQVAAALDKAGASNVETTGSTVTKSAPGSSALIQIGERRVDLGTHLQTLVNEFVRGWDEDGERTFEWPTASSLVIAEETIPIDGLKLTIEQHTRGELITVAASGIADLVLRYLDKGEEDDEAERVIYRHELGDSPPPSSGDKSD